MNDLELDLSSHDLVIENGDLKLLNKEERVAQQTLKINLLFFRGEWFLNVEYGVPYFQSIFKKTANKSLVDSIIRGVILKSYNIASINTFESEIRDGTYSVTEMEATTFDGEIVSITNQIIF